VIVVVPEITGLKIPKFEMVATLILLDFHGFVVAAVPLPLSSNVLPIQTEFPPKMIGFEFTVIERVVAFAHCPELGVNVYVVVAVLFMDGAHVPVTELFEVVGKAVNVAPEQMAETCVNVGVTGLFTVINEVRKQPLLLV
jgi:hypothetical protein